jgi:ATP-dependent Clp protease protease subunit
MNSKLNDFQKFAISRGVNGLVLNDYEKTINGGGYINPSIVEERQLNAITMDVFSKLISQRIIVLGTEIDSDVANIINAQMMYLNSVDSESDIKLWINSPGGSVIDGLSIYDIMNWVDCDVATYTMGMAASMGSILLSSGTRGKRHSLPHSKILIHQPMGGVAPHTQESDFAIAYEQIKQCKDTLYNILSENTGKSIEEITADADRDHWLNAQEALPNIYGPYGLIDDIVKKNGK